MLGSIVTRGGQGNRALRLRFTVEEVRQLTARLTVKPKMAFSGDLQRGLTVWFAPTGFALDAIPLEPPGSLQSFINRLRVAAADKHVPDIEMVYKVQTFDGQTRFFIAPDNRLAQAPPFNTPRLVPARPAPIVTSNGPRSYEPPPLAEGPPPPDPLVAEDETVSEELRNLFAPKEATPGEEIISGLEEAVAVAADKAPPTVEITKIATVKSVTDGEISDLKAALSMVNEIAAKLGENVSLRVEDNRITARFREVRVVWTDL